MTDTPEDILAAAEKANTMGWHQDRVKSIASAILAERERCAAIVSGKLEQGRQAISDYGKDPYWEGFSASAFMALRGIRTP